MYVYTDMDMYIQNRMFSLFTPVFRFGTRLVLFTQEPRLQLRKKDQSQAQGKGMFYSPTYLPA